METSIRFWCQEFTSLVVSRPTFIHNTLAVRLCPPLIFRFLFFLITFLTFFNKGNVTLMCFHPVGLQWRKTAAEFRCTHW